MYLRSNAFGEIELEKKGQLGNKSVCEIYLEAALILKCNTEARHAISVLTEEHRGKDIDVHVELILVGSFPIPPL